MFPDTIRAYDRAITVFSPDGRLLQVEYALTATKRTPLALGAKCVEGVVLMAKRPGSPLLSLPGKIYKIDDHIGAIAAGLVGDGLVLVDRGRIEAQSHRLIYNEPITVENLARRIALFKQSYTQYAGVRPFGVVMIFGGIDDKPRLYVTHPGGAYFSYLAVAMGKGSDEVNEFLRKNYKEDLSLNDTIKLLMKQTIKTSEEKLAPKDFEVAIVPVETKMFRFLTQEEIKKYLDEAQSELKKEK
ncbi:MAG: proteasome subunit alpha [Thermoproteota archaeon]|nr:MAG: proteasome subunit alpha [Candidatus Korarchaeota archaeon]